MSSAETSEVIKSTKRADVLMGWPVVLFDWLEPRVPGRELRPGTPLLGTGLRTWGPPLGGPNKSHIPGTDSLSAVSTAMIVMAPSPGSLSNSAMVLPTTTARNALLTYTS